MISVYENKVKVGEIPKEKIEEYFYLFWGYKCLMPEWSFLMSGMRHLEKWERNFYCVYFLSGIWICKDNEIFVIDAEFMYNVLRIGEPVIIEWEKVEKNYNWWAKMNLLVKYGVEDIFDISEIEGGKLKEKIDNFKKEVEAMFKNSKRVFSKYLGLENQAKKISKKREE